MIRRHPLFFLLGLTVLCFASGLMGTFVLYDDDLHIFRNPVMRLSLGDALQYYWSQVHKGFYIPVTYTVWTVLVALFRPSDPLVTFDNLTPIPFHAANLIFHLLNIALLWRLSSKFTQRVGVRFLATALFAIHPVQVESIAWATGLKDVLAGTFSLISMLIYWNGGRQRFFAGIFFLMAVLSKPAAIVLPLGIVLIDLLWKRQPWRTTVFSMAIWVLLALPVSLITSKSQPLEYNAFAVPYWLRLSVMTDAALFYLTKLLIPYPLIHDYGRNPEWLQSSPFVLLSPILFLGLVLFLVKRRSLSLLSCLLLFCLWILPVSGVVQFSFQNFSTVADHYLYFPLIGIALSLCYFVDKIPLVASKRNVAFRSALVALGILSLLTLKQVRVWKDSPTLLGHTIQYNPRSVLAHNNFGVYYEWLEDWENALKSYHAAYEAGPRFTHHLYNLGNLYMRTQRLTEAEKYFIRTLEQQQKYPDAHFNLGLISEARGDLASAEAHFRKALEQEPAMYSACVKLAGIYHRLNRWDLAKFYFERGIELNPLSPQAHHHYARALRKRGLTAESEEHFRAAQTLEPIDKAAKNPKALLAK